MSHHTRALASDRLRTDIRGAAYVEFLIAFMPILVAFIGMWMLGELFVTKLVVAHAAFMGARAAAVYIPRPDATGAVSNQLTDASWFAINDAVAIACAPALTRGWMPQVPDISLPDNLHDDAASEATTYSPDGDAMVHVRLYGEYTCHFPPFDTLFCDAGTIPVEGHGSFPYAGAHYEYEAQATQ